MEKVGGQFSRGWTAGRLAWVLALIFCAAGAGFSWLSHRIDEAALRGLATSVSQYETAPDDKALSLMRFVHDNGATRRNEGWFGLPAWRATALQVVGEGGDCADKSRLLVALLTGLGMRATPVLCFDAESGAPAHTIVEVEIAPGSYMVLDPAFDLWFPKVGGGYHDLMELRSDQNIVSQRVAELQRASDDGATPDAYYLRASAEYHTAATFNWERGPVVRTAFFALHALLGDEVYRIHRPRWMEEPKLKAMTVCLICGLMITVLPVLLRILARMRSVAWNEIPPVATIPPGAAPILE